jgi:hypothetical protein
MLASGGKVGKRRKGQGVPAWSDIERSTSPMVRALRTWWLTHCVDTDVPDRRALWPGDIAELLPCVLIAELEPDPFRIRYRLVGTKVVTVAGFEFTGRHLDEFQRAGAGVPWEDYYRTVIATRQPLLGEATVPTQAGGTFRYEFGIFPLTLGGRDVRQFVAVEDYFDFDFRSAQWGAV